MTTLSYNEIKIGDIFQFERILEKPDEELFAKLTGDNSSSSIVHGMLVASLFSTLLDMYYPGPGAVYVSQTLQFRNPVLYGNSLLIRGKVTAKSDATRIIIVYTEILSLGQIKVSGEAQIIVPK